MMHCDSLKMMIFLPLYNVEEWIETTFSSIKKQTHKDFKAFFLDDNSTDNSYLKLLELCKEDERFSVIKNEKRVGVLENLYVNITNIARNMDENTIIVDIDGDDWFARNDALQKIYEAHMEGNYITHGTFLRYPEFLLIEEGEYDKETKEEASYRTDRWRCSGIRTFRKFLWDKIKKEDLLDKEGNFYSFTSDQALMYPLLENSEGKIKYFDMNNCFHVYNRLNPLNDDKISRMKQISSEMEIRKVDFETLSKINTLKSNYKEYSLNIVNIYN